MQIKGRAWVFGRNINTDLIFPKTYFRPIYEPGEMGSHLMQGFDPDFPNKARAGDIFVGGDNFGCGSSREEAAGAMREAGIAAVVAPSFGRLFTRNCINLGVPVIVVPGIDRHVQTGDEIQIDLTGRTLVNPRSGFETQFAPMAAEALQLIAEGGIIGYTKRRLAERRALDTSGVPRAG